MTKPILHLFPGFDGSAVFFAPIIKALEADVTCVAHKLPLEGPQDYDSLIEKFSPALDTPCYLLGESFSGPLTIQLAHKFPDRVKGTILSTTFARTPFPPGLRELMTFGVAFRNMMPFQEVFSNMFIVNGAMNLTANEIEVEMRKLSSETLRGRTQACVHVDVSDMFQAQSQPALILNAEHDRVIGTGNHFPIRPELCEEIVMDCPHMLLQTLPDEAATHIKRFMKVV